MRKAAASFVAFVFLVILCPRPVLANALPYYYLPWDIGVSRVVTQGNNQGSHTGYSAYAWDFGGDGWLVRAARSGTISKMKDSSTVGACDSSYAPFANYVKITSTDGNDTLYLHLAYGSVSGRVSLNQLVARDTAIGLTDNTGWSCGPHLHYQVQVACSDFYCQSVPSSFADPDVLSQDSNGVPLVNQTLISADTGYGIPLSGGQWLLRKTDSSGYQDITVSFGVSRDLPVPGKWYSISLRDGPGVFRAGTWLLRGDLSTGPADLTFQYGLASDIPVVGDWTGQGNETIGVARAENGNLNWYLRNTNGSGPPDIGPFTYGWATDIPVVGKWTGTGRTGIGVVRQQNGGLTWYLRNTATPGNPDIPPFQYGIWSDIPKTGSWTGSCTDTIGVARADPSGGSATWYLRNSNSAGNPDITPFPYGLSTDAYLVGNWISQSPPTYYWCSATIGVGR